MTPFMSQMNSSRLQKAAAKNPREEGNQNTSSHSEHQIRPQILLSIATVILISACSQEKDTMEFIKCHTNEHAEPQSFLTFESFEQASDKLAILIDTFCYCF